MNFIDSIKLCFKSHKEQVKQLEDARKVISFYADKRLTITYNHVFCTSDPRLQNIDYETGIDKGVTMHEKGAKAELYLIKYPI